MSNQAAHAVDLSTYPILQQIGNTPLVKIDVFSDELPDVEIYAKAEMYNPGGSIKDRSVLRDVDGSHPVRGVESGQNHFWTQARETPESRMP